MRANTRTLGLLALGGLVLTSLSAAREGPDPAAAAAGKPLYLRYCASCHGREGHGDGVVAPDLAVLPTDLTRLAEKSGGRFPYDEVVASIDGRTRTRAHGSPDMPVWGTVFPRPDESEARPSESTLARLAHYIWSIQME